MATIINESAHQLQPSSQQAVRNAAANCGLDKVEAKFAYNNLDEQPVFHVYDTARQYQFSIDTGNDEIFNKDHQ